MERLRQDDPDRSEPGPWAIEAEGARRLSLPGFVPVGGTAGPGHARPFALVRTNSLTVGSG
ncbi:hypothetical protein [Streptomyces sp. NPDC005181]|uniref:hypothetical protein n=1 Tax=Streptomyces sp. NPDC005181 TaxID=3156869 RepID=UPI0033A4A487